MFSGNVRWKWGFWESRSLAYMGLISSWPSRHKTYRRRQPFRSADHGKLPGDVQLNEVSAGISRDPVEPWQHSVFLVALRVRRSRRLRWRLDSHFHFGAWLEAYLVAIFVRQSVLYPNLSI